MTCTRGFADEHPELVTAYLKGLVRVGRWCNAHKWAAATLLEETGFYPARELTYEHTKRLDFVPNLSPMNLGPGDREGLHAGPRVHQERLQRERLGCAGVPGRRWRELLEEQWTRKTSAKLPETAAPLASGERLG